MSLNQSRSDKYDSQFRKPGGGRSGNSSGGQHRPFSGGRGRGGAGPTSAPTPNNNRSYKKVNNAQGAQSRANPVVVNTSDFNPGGSGARSVENGVHSQYAVQGGPRTTAASVVGKPADAAPQKTSRPLPRAPSSQSSSVNSDSALPSTPVKGDGASPYSLQFGSISPGLLNVQVPARTSSAPPNLDEQKRDQARRDPSRAEPPIPLPVAKQEISKKDVACTEKPILQQIKTEPQVKGDVHVASASLPTQTQKPSALPMAGISMPRPFHQQTASMQFGGPNPQIQSQGVPTSSLQMSLQIPLQMGNPSQVQQQLFVQHSLMQTQGIMHQGQNLGYNPQLATQLPHQLGNMGINMSSQYNQQATGNFGSARKTVKITHPDTHEELRLDGRDGGPSGSIPHHSVPSQNQSLPTYTTSHPMGYYSNSYTPGPPFFPVASSLPLTSTQLNSTTQGSRFSYPVSQAQSTVNQPSNTFPVKSGVSKFGVANPSNADRNVHNMIAPAQPSSVPVTIKAVGDKATKLTSVGKVEPPKLLNPKLESCSHKKDIEVSFQSKSGVGESAPEPTCVPVEASNPATSPAVRSISPGDLASNPSSVDAISKAVDDMSTRNIQTQLNIKGNLQPSHQVDKQSESEVLKVSDDFSNAATSKKICTSAGLGNGATEAIRSSTIVTDGAADNAPAVEVSANTSQSSESCESQNVINKAANQNDAPCEITSSDPVIKDREEKHPEELSSDIKPKGLDAFKEAEQDHPVKHVQKHGLVGVVVKASEREADSAGSVSEDDKMQSKLSSVSDISVSTTSSGLLDIPSIKDCDALKSSVLDNDVIPVSADTLEANAGDETECVENPRPSSSCGSISGSSKSSMESNKTKNRGKKKLKELLQKADALGTTTDLYMAYKGPEDKKESVVALEHSVESDMKVSADDSTDDSRQDDNHEKSKIELDDWEDAADISTPKLEFARKAIHDEEGLNGKKYSRDFLLTFSENCKDLPEGFEITSDMTNLVGEAVSAHRSDRDHLSSGRAVDRPSPVARHDRRGNVTMDADRWNKQPGPFPPTQDPRMDLAYGSNVLGFQGGRGPAYGVLRNPQPQGPAQHTGGILSGPMHSLGFQGLQRNNSDADRWQRGTNFNKGLMPPPHTPVPVMHKAERKYEVGKVTDEEQAKQRKLKGILNKLTPQNFERLFEQVKEVNIDNVVTLNGVISQIFDKALTEPTFCEMYANFCQHLAAELPDLSVDNEKITFKRLLLNKCQEEFERGEREEQEANSAGDEGDTQQSEQVREEKRVQARKRMLGNIRLIGELYKKRMLTERIMHECIKKLLGQYQNPDEENIEALCKLMSTIGEMIDHPKAKEHMDAYFEIMGQLSTNMKLSSRVRFMLRDAIDLRKNKWQQRRKVDGPKKIEEVHRDAAQEKQVQTSRLTRGPSMNSAMRRGQPLDFGPRGSMLSSPIGPGMGFRGMPSQVRGFGGQDMRMDERNIFDSRTLSVLPQRSTSDEPITLGPQGGLARGMAFRGQPSVSSPPLFENSPSFGDPRRMVGGMNGYGAVQDRGVYNAREDHLMRNTSDRFGAPLGYDQSNGQELNSSHMNRESRFPDRNVNRSRPITPPAPRTGAAPQNISSENVWPEERLRSMSIAAIKEFYSAKDENEVALCIKELNAPSFHPTVLSMWVSDSFERKDIERDLLAKLLVSLTKSRDGTFSPNQLIQGFESVLTNLEDTVTDAPKAPEFLGRIFAKVVLENVLPLKEVGRLIQHGGEEPGSLREAGLAGEVLGSLLEMIKSEKGESTLKEIRASCNLQLEDFRPPEPIRCRKLEMFM